MANKEKDPLRTKNQRNGKEKMNEEKTEFYQLNTSFRFKRSDEG